MANGYIYLHRRLFDSRLWSLPPDEFRLASYLMLKARWQKRPKKLQHVAVKRGELVTSLSDIAENCSWFENRKRREWSRQKVMRLLASLVKCEFCALNSDTYGTHITICNYDAYQQAGGDNSDSGGTDMEQQCYNRVHILRKKEGEEKPTPIVCAGVEVKPPPKPKPPKSFKRWTEAEFREDCAKANHDGFLLPVEVEEFVGHWIQPSGTGRFGFTLQKTWSTRKRMQTAYRMIYEKRRKPGYGSGLVAENTPTMVRIGRWFGRDAELRWSVAEAENLSIWGERPEDEMDKMERFYLANLPEDDDTRRHSLGTLLKDWNGAADGARRWAAKQKNSGSW